MGFLSDDERLALSITDMSLHVVGPAEEFKEEPKRPKVEHENFFLDRVRDNDIDSVYKFTEHSTVQAIIQNIVDGSTTFEVGAQELAREFAKLHVAASKEGAFFVFDMTAGQGVRVFCLIKYDYHEAIEQQVLGNQNVLRQIIHAFVKERRAVQKCCLVRVQDGKVEEAISARDRVRPSPELSDYFYKYLGVIRTRDDAELTREVVNAIREVLVGCREHLPNKDVGSALGKAKEALRLRQDITSEAVSEIIIGVAGSPEDENVISAFQGMVEKRMKSLRLEGLSFKPDKAVLGRPAKRRLKTAEGVLIEYFDKNDNTVTRVKNPDGGETITVRTEKVIEDEPIKDKS